jgi:hypothetical protein
MLRRNFLYVLIAAVPWMGSAGCRGAASSAHTVQGQISSNAETPISDTRQTPRNVTHTRPLRRVTPHESFLSTYNNPEEGISFRYPRNYSLEEGDIQEHSFFLERQDDLDTDQPGAKLLVTVLIPEDGYPNTSFEHGSLQLTVNQAETESGCLEMSQVEAMGNGSRALTVEGMALHWSEQETEIAGTKILQREYAGYSHGTCYQFRLILAAEESLDPNGFAKAADLVRIMKHLESIVASLRISAKIAPRPVEISNQTVACDRNHAKASRAPTSSDLRHLE